MNRQTSDTKVAGVLALAVGLYVGAANTVSAASFALDGVPVIIYDTPSTLEPVILNPGGSTFTFGTPIDPDGSTQINNLGFRSTDGLLYGWERTTATSGQIVTIDSAGTVLGLGNPGLPANQPIGDPTAYNYNAGDVSVNGNEMYLSYSVANGGGDKLYIVDLTTASIDPSDLTIRDITGDTGQVADWAAHPTTGMLWGGDHTDNGQLASLNPVTGLRTDYDLAGLLDPAGDQGFGASWFDNTGRLYLYDNNGIIYAIDDVGGTPTLVNGDYPLTNVLLNTTNNDGAAYAGPVVPIPAAIWLFGSGLIGLVGIARRKKS